MEKEHLIKLLSEDKLDKVFEILFNAYKNSKSSSNEIVLIQADYYELRSRELKGTIRYEELQVRKNQIREKLLGFIDSPNKKTSFTSKIEDYFSAPFDQLASFKMTLDLGVARYMGERKGFVDSILWSLSGNDKSDRHEGHFTNGFDWNESTIWTTCDARLATNTWHANSGNLEYHAEGNQESNTTYFVDKFNLGAVFGNGLYLFISDMSGRIIHEIRNNETPYNIFKMCVDRAHGKEIISLKNDSSEFAILFFEVTRNYQPLNYHRMEISNGLIRGERFTSWQIKRKRFKDEREAYTLLHGAESNNGINRKIDLFLINNTSKKILAQQILDGIQDISCANNQRKIAVLGKELSVLNFDTLEVENSIALSLSRIDYDIGVITYSSCDRFLSIFYSAIGELEIRDAQHLNIIYAIPNHGIPQSDMAWDVSGRFLACRFKNRETGKMILLVFDIKNKKEVLRISNVIVKDGNVGFRWSPYSSKIACLVDRSRIQVFELGG